MDGALDLSARGRSPSVNQSPERDGDSPALSDQSKEDVRGSDGEERKNTPSPHQTPSPSPTPIHPVFGHLPPFQFPAGMTNFMDMTKMGTHKNMPNSLPGIQAVHPGFNMFNMDPKLAATPGVYNPLAAAQAMGMAGLGFPFHLNPAAGLPLPQPLSDNSQTPPQASHLPHRKRKRSRQPDVPVTSEYGQFNHMDNPLMKSSDTVVNGRVLSDNMVSTSDVTSGSITSETSMSEMPGQIDRRRKNNEAAKRSRDTRRFKEAEIAVRAAILEEENLKLKAQVAVLKNETSKLHVMLYQM